MFIRSSVRQTTELKKKSRLFGEFEIYKSLGGLLFDFCKVFARLSVFRLPFIVLGRHQAQACFARHSVCAKCEQLAAHNAVLH